MLRGKIRSHCEDCQGYCQMYHVKHTVTYYGDVLSRSNMIPSKHAMRKPLSCPTCKRRFRFSQHLKTHMKLHETDVDVIGDFEFHSTCINANES